MTAGAPSGRDPTEEARVRVLEEAARIAVRHCRGSGMERADTEDCVSWVQMRIIETGYRLVNEFRGETRFEAYLSAAVRNLVRDYRDKIWGRWRPSAVASRMGELAVRLETLVVRDGLTISAAAERLRGAGFPELSDFDAARVVASLPRRCRPRSVGPDALQQVTGGLRPDEAFVARERDEARRRAHDAVQAALDTLPAEDQAIVELRYGGEQTVADVARDLGIEQRPLYRRIPRILRQIRCSPRLAHVDPEELCL